MKTYSPKPEHIERAWYVVDATDKVLGRLASEVAALLRGKHKPIYAPHMDVGDHVVVINADKVVVTGGKELKKVAYRHSGYPGGITGVRYDELLATRPVFAVEKAVRGMLPKNRLGRSMINKLHVVAGPEHPHGAQRPVDYTLGRPPVWAGLPQPRVRGPEVVELKTRHLTKDEPPVAPEGEPTAAEPASKPLAKTTTAKKTTTKKSTAKKTTASAKKTTAKKTTASAKKTTAKKTTAKKKPAAKKPTATAPKTEKTSEE